MKLNEVRSGSFVCLHALAQRSGLVILCGLLVGCAAQSVPAGSASPSSIGAYHAARVTLEHPEMVQTLILADSATLSPPIGNVAERRAAIGLGTGAGARSPGATLKDQLRFSLEALSKNREHITEEFLSAAVYMASLPNGKKTDAAMRGDAAKRYEEIIAKGAEEMRGWIKEGRLQTPTLLYWGNNDPSAIPAVGLALFDMISEKNPRARMLIVNNAGHFHYREHPEEFTRNVINFATGWSKNYPRR